MEKKNYFYYVAINKQTKKFYIGKVTDINKITQNMRVALKLKGFDLLDWDVLVNEDFGEVVKLSYLEYIHDKSGAFYKLINKQPKIFINVLESIKELMTPESRLLFITLNLLS